MIKVGIIGVSRGNFGGVRGVEALKHVLNALEMHILKYHVYFAVGIGDR